MNIHVSAELREKTSKIYLYLYYCLYQLIIVPNYQINLIKGSLGNTDPNIEKGIFRKYGHNDVFVLNVIEKQ